jgi:IS605 OrfB family transposase
VDASAAQVGVLARHAGAARFAFNECLSLVKQALDARAVDRTVVVPWSGFDLINAFYGWKHRHVRDVRQHYLHKVANALVKTHDRIAKEDLNITGMLANHHLAGAIADAAWAELARILSYKQHWRGGQVLPVDRWFPSTWAGWVSCSRFTGSRVEMAHPKKLGGRDELLADFVFLVTMFAGRLYGVRGAQNRRRLLVESGQCPVGGRVG